MGIILNISPILVLLSLLGDHAEGSPIKARNMWVRCRPNSTNANCVTEKGPWMDLPEPDRRPLIADKNEDQSEEGSGNGRVPFLEVGSGDQWENDIRLPGGFTAEMRGTDLDGSPELDSSDLTSPQKVHRKDSVPFDQDLQEENLIL